jgi:hypothetical protein
MPLVYDTTFMETTHAGIYDQQAEVHFGDAVLRIGLPRPDSWCKYGWKVAPGSTSDYLLEVDDIGIVGGFEPGFDWNEQPFTGYGSYIWPVATKTEIDANPFLSVTDKLRLADDIRTAGNHRSIVAARTSERHHPTAYVSFDRHVTLQGDTIFYRLGDVSAYNHGAVDDNGEFLELGAAFAAASIQVRADWAAIQHHIEKAGLTAKLHPIVITRTNEATNPEVMFYEIMRVAIDQLYDNHEYRAETGKDLAIVFEEPVLSSSPCWDSLATRMPC